MTHSPVGYFGHAVLLFLLVLVSLWAARWLVGDRIVSQVTTAGTTISLGEGPPTYFDSFLDEIVAFFDAVEPEYVIFEDLDRFEDPQIFDSLRELNTLVNAPANWQTREKPLRFIYAIKDSLFEQLGAETESKGGAEKSKNGEAEAGDGQDSSKASAKPRLDVAVAAVLRANRTKFFEIVIPMVPFISHRIARDHLVSVGGLLFQSLMGSETAGRIVPSGAPLDLRISSSHVWKDAKHGRQWFYGKASPLCSSGIPSWIR